MRDCERLVRISACQQRAQFCVKSSDRTLVETRADARAGPDPPAPSLVAIRLHEIEGLCFQFREAGTCEVAGRAAAWCVSTSLCVAGPMVKPDAVTVYFT